MVSTSPPAPALVDRPFRASAQSVTRGQLRARRYRRIVRGVYWAGDGPVHHGRRVQAALTVLPAHAVVAGRSAMWFWGAQVADQTTPVDVILDPRIPGHARSRPGLNVWRYELDEGDWVLTPHGRVTSPARTAFDVGRLGAPLTTVPLLDALLRATGVQVEEVAQYRRLHPGARRTRLLGRALTMVDPSAESPRESLLRVHVLESGLPTPVVNYTVRHGGAFIARVDLAWPALKVAVEYDGAYHDDPAQVARDRIRLNNLRAAGWAVIVVDRHQILEPAQVVATIGRVLVTRGA